MVKFLKGKMLTYNSILKITKIKCITTIPIIIIQVLQIKVLDKLISKFNLIFLVQTKLMFLIQHRTHSKTILLTVSTVLIRISLLTKINQGKPPTILSILINNKLSDILGASWVQVLRNTSKML